MSRDGFPDEFDDIDRALASGLSALAPEVDGADETLASLRPRFRRARTRNRAMKVGGALAVLAVIASVAAVAAPSSRRAHVQVSSPSTAPDKISKPARSSTTTTTTTSAPRVAPTSPTTASSAPAGSHQPGSSPTTPGTVPGTTPATTPGGGDNGGHSDGGDGQGHGASTPTSFTSSANGVHRYHSGGGSVAVRYSHGELTIVSVSPASGYRVTERRNDPDEVEVRFENDHSGWRVRVRVQDGLLTGDIGRT